MHSQEGVLAGVILLPWFARLHYDYKGTKNDTCTVFVICVLKYWKILSSFAFNSFILACLVPVFSLAVIGFVFACSRNGKSESGDPTNPQSEGTKTEPNSPSLRPLLFPCRTTHTRFFPEKHSFSYSYLFVGIPIGWHGKTASTVSVDSASASTQSGNLDGSPNNLRRAWFNVDAADYLERGNYLSLQDKLRAYLQSEVLSTDHL